MYKSKQFILVFPLLIAILLMKSKTNGSFIYRNIATQPGVSPEISRSYQEFSVDLSRGLLKYHEQQKSKHSAVLFPFNVAYVLAVAHAQIWPIPTTGFDKVFHLESTKIQNAYERIIAAATKDNDLNVHSNIYTSTNGIDTPQNITDLKTRVYYIDYNSPNTNTAVMQMNAMISAQTFDKNYRDLIPLGGWFGSAIFNYTLGVFTNTLYFRGEWEYPFYSMGTMEFGTGENQIPFLEAHGNFTVYQEQDRDFRALRIPIKNSSKVLILVQPRNGKTIEDFIDRKFKEFINNRRSLKNFGVGKQLRIRVPSFNITTANSFAYILHQMGLKSSMCQLRRYHDNTFNGFAQTVYAHLGEDKFELASATGASLINVADFYETHGINPEKPGNGTTNGDAENENSDRSDGVTVTPPKPPSQMILETDESDPEGIVSINSPFLWYLEDELTGLGPLVFGTMEPPTTSTTKPEEVPEGFEWLRDLEKYMIWSCPDREL